YCDRCCLEWRCAEEGAWHESMAEYVVGGRFVVTSPESEAPLSPEQVRERGRERATRMRDGSLSVCSWHGWGPWILSWLGQPAERGNGPHFAFAAALHQRVDRK